MKNIFKFQIACLVISIASSGILNKFVIKGSIDPAFASDITQMSHLVLWLLALFGPFIIPNSADRNARYVSFFLVWGFIGTVFPMWDLNWSLNNASVFGATIEDTDKWLYMTYAMADSRFVISEPYVIVQEFLSGILAFILGYTVFTFLRGNTKKACYIFFALCFVKFYANAVFLGTEIVEGFVHITPGITNYIKVFGQNGLWTFAPPFAMYFIYQLMKDPSFNIKETLRTNFGVGKKKKLAA